MKLRKWNSGTELNNKLKFASSKKNFLFSSSFFLDSMFLIPQSSQRTENNSFQHTLHNG